MPLTRLKIPVRNIDSGGPDGTFEVYTFFGDGVVSTDEWASGSLSSTLTGLTLSFENLYVDVTSQLQLGVDLTNPFLSFNFRTLLGNDRYDLALASPFVPAPTLEVGVTAIPEPASFSLLGIAAVGFLRRMRKQDASRAPGR